MVGGLGAQPQRNCENDLGRRARNGAPRRGRKRTWGAGAYPFRVTLLRTHIGTTLRQARISQERTLRDVAKQARVSLGYLSEVERGQKEASSELLNAICVALNLSLATVLVEVTSLVKLHESPVLTVVDTNAA